MNSIALNSELNFNISDLSTYGFLAQDKNTGGGNAITFEKEVFAAMLQIHGNCVNDFQIGLREVYVTNTSEYTYSISYSSDEYTGTDI